MSKKRQESRDANDRPISLAEFLAEEGETAPVVPSTPRKRGAGAKAGTATLAKRANSAIDFSEQLDAADERKFRIETIRMARAIAMAGLPKRPTAERDLVRTLRLGGDLWLRVTHSTTRGNRLPYGEDRFVLAGIQHLAIEAASPVVFFEKVGQLLEMFDIDQNGRSLRVLRDRFERIAGLSVHLAYARTQEDLDNCPAVEQVFVIRKYALPSRKDLEAEKAGQLTFPKILDDPELNDSPYGVVLSEDFWSVLQETKNRLLMPLDLLKLFIDRPTGWDYACFLVARCGSARSASVVPHEALISLFRDSPKEADRHVIRRLKRYHEEIRVATGGRLSATFFEDEPARVARRGRPKKRWSLRVAPSSSLLGKKLLALPPSSR